MLYKRGVNLDNLKTEYVLTSDLGVYINSTISSINFYPNQGIYVKQNLDNSEIYLSKFILKVQIDKKIYEIVDIKTNEKDMGGYEYLESFDINPCPTYTYIIDNVHIIKQYMFIPGTNTLCVSYKVKNISKKNVKLEILPCITKRNIFNVLRKQNMKFTSLITPTDVKVSLNISNNLELYLKSKLLRYEKNEEYIQGVNTSLEIDESNIKTFVEDFFVPGKFEAIIKAGNTNTYEIYVDIYDMDIRRYNSLDIIRDVEKNIKLKTKDINENYYELQALAKNAYSFNYLDINNKNFVISEAIPNKKNKKNYINNIISSIEGNYIILKRYKEAKKILEAIMVTLKEKQKNQTNSEYFEAILLYIEALNRFIQEADLTNEEKLPFYNYIKEKVYEYIENRNEFLKMDIDSMIYVDGKKYIKLNCLWYNALKIFENLSFEQKENSDYIYTVSENLSKNIVEKFFSEEKKVLKCEITEEPYANFDMLYSLSLSYPLLHEKIAMQLVDTAFKELYTPLGMRLFSKQNEKYDGYIYPHLMVHFIKANLRQMGVTRATQKLAYNLVKDLLLELNKEIIGTVNYKYFEKQKRPIGNVFSALTNAELIRLYDMLT